MQDTGFFLSMWQTRDKLGSCDFPNVIKELQYDTEPQKETRVNLWIEMFYLFPAYTLPLHRRAKPLCTWQWDTGELWWFACYWAVRQTLTSRTARERRPWCSHPRGATHTSQGCCWRGAFVTWPWLTRWYCKKKKKKVSFNIILSPFAKSVRCRLPYLV